jgi:predicted small metal-binding protein
LPFISKCVSCGYFVSANTIDDIIDKKKQHQQKSHPNNRFLKWIDITVSREDYEHIQKSMKHPEFWKAVRMRHKPLLFSRMGYAGSISLCKPN